MGPSSHECFTQFSGLHEGPGHVFPIRFREQAPRFTSLFLSCRLHHMGQPTRSVHLAIRKTGCGFVQRSHHRRVGEPESGKEVGGTKGGRGGDGAGPSSLGVNQPCRHHRTSQATPHKESSADTKAGWQPTWIATPPSPTPRSPGDDVWRSRTSQWPSDRVSAQGGVPRCAEGGRGEQRELAPWALTTDKERVVRAVTDS